MYNEERYIDEIGDEQGWDAARKLSHCMTYICNQGDDQAFRDFLLREQEDENDGYEHEAVAANNRWLSDEIQFARFIAEAEAEGLFSGHALTPVAESMDLAEEYVCEIIERAQRAWEAIKATV